MLVNAIQLPMTENVTLQYSYDEDTDGVQVRVMSIRNVEKVIVVPANMTVEEAKTHKRLILDSSGEAVSVHSNSVTVYIVADGRTQKYDSYSLSGG